MKYLIARMRMFWHCGTRLHCECTYYELNVVTRLECASCGREFWRKP